MEEREKEQKEEVVSRECTRNKAFNWGNSWMDERASLREFVQRKKTLRRRRSWVDEEEKKRRSLLLGRPTTFPLQPRSKTGCLPVFYILVCVCI